MLWVFDVEKRTIFNAFRQFWIFLGGNLKIANICFWWSVRPKVFGVRLDAGAEPMYRQISEYPPPVVKIKLAVGNEQML